MNKYKDYSQADYLNILPLSDESKLKIINDFIKTGQYDKICEKKMKCEDMIVKDNIIKKDKE
jgi:hypothetical protein